MRAVVAGGEAEWTSEARRILLGEGLTCESEDVVGYDRLQDCLAAGHPDVVLVYCDAGGKGLEAVRAARRLAAGTVLAAGEPDVALMREAVRAGAREYLDVNSFRQDLAAALAAIRTSHSEVSKRGRIVTVFSPIGGVGVSTIALNLAVSLAKLDGQTGGTVALIDLTPPPSDLSLLLDLEPKHTLGDVLCHRERLDRRLLAGAMTLHGSGLHVLPQAGFTEDLSLPEFDLNAAFVRQMFVLLRTSYESVVVDLGHAFTAAQIEAVRLSSTVLLPVVADVPGLRRARWTLDKAVSLGIGRERFQIVLNRYGGKNQVAKAKVEDALHTPILTTIADHGPLLTGARNEGLPAVELSGGLAAAFTALARTVCGNLAGTQEVRA